MILLIIMLFAIKIEIFYDMIGKNCLKAVLWETGVRWKKSITIMKF